MEKLRIDLGDVTFRELMPAPADLDGYRAHIVPGMSTDDIYSPEEFGERLEDGRLRAWWLEHEGEIAGWCALGPNHNKYRPRADHLFGVWVRSDMRKRGLAAAAWEFRIALVPPQAAITVSIQPNKIASIALATRFGFREISRATPWINYTLDRA